MSFSFGNNYKITLFGQSHSSCVGVVVDGIPAGVKLDITAIRTFLDRRRPGKNISTTQRKENDIPKIISGLNADGKTCGAPLTVIIKNNDINDKDYENFNFLPRPSHSDYSASVKYNGENDYRGGGAFSARLTSALCVAGSIAIQLMDKVQIASHISSVGKIKDTDFNRINPDNGTFCKLNESDLPVIDDTVKSKIINTVNEAKRSGDSIGGTIECAITGFPAGIGQPPFDGIENVISKIIYAIPAVHGIEFGSGFAGTESSGSENNDQMKYNGDKVEFSGNNNGGILGGITTGQPIVFKVAFKPTPSIAKKQTTVNLKTKETEQIEIGGRHDPCVVLRAAPIVEAAAAIALYDSLVSDKGNA